MAHKITTALDFRPFAIAQQAANQLVVFRNLTNDRCYKAMLNLIKTICKPDCAANTLLIAYYELFACLLKASEDLEGPSVGDAWQNHLLELIIDGDNPLGRQVQKNALHKIAESLRAAAAHDLQCLQKLISLDTKTIKEFITNKLNSENSDSLTEPLPTWENLQTAPHQLTDIQKNRLKIKESLFKAAQWETKLAELAEYYATNGITVFGKYWALRWCHQENGGYLTGIAHHDPIKLENLIGYETERQAVIQNTEQFLHGFPANNLLLYGERGTGKSSTIKALLNRYGSQGLRLIELSKYDFGDIPHLFKLLNNQNQYFIIFIDDLSFENDEKYYKDLKAALEGSLEARPKNVLVYATSNRRHLVKETFADRNKHLQPDNEDVHIADTQQEKLSLADRFGITITFLAPSQEQYLKIVTELARQRNIIIDHTELCKLALHWELRQNNRSGRTAQQFIDYLEGKIGMEKFHCNSNCNM